MLPIPVISKPRWRVLDLFKRRLGAWFEPRQGSMWQENTGATPTTTGGQTVGKLVDLTAARVASQATAANRPIYGVRRNLLTYSEDFSNGVWIKDAVTVTANAALAPNGTQTADLLIPSVVNTYHGLYYQGLPNSGVNGGYTLYAKPSGYNKIRVWNGGGAGQAVDIDLQTSQIINTGGSVVSATVTQLDNGWVEIKLVELISVYFYISVLREVDGAYTPFEGDGVSGIYLWGADLRYTADIPSYPLYQRITTATDYDPGPYPALAHDGTDSLSVALPAINVRRNLLTYSEDFSNGVWMKDAVTVTSNAALAPNGTQTADLLIPSIVNAYHAIYYQGLSNSGVNGGYTLYAKASGYNKIRVWNGAGVSYSFDIDLQAAQIINIGGSVVSATVTQLDNGWVEIKLVELISVYFFISVLREVDGAYTPFEGDGVSGIYIWGAEVTLASEPNNTYQKITDWTSEQYSSAGSVYFGVPQGMSALHNQSIGTTYTLPAANSNIYGWCVFPERLTRPEEAQLERYFLKLAGISGGPDYLLDDDYNQLTEDAGELLLRA